MKPLFLLLLLVFSAPRLSIAKEKTNTINIHFDGKDYKNLELIIRLDDGSKHFSGQSKNGKDWTFNYPDSIYNTHQYMRIGVPGNVDTIGGDIIFKTIIGKDTLGVGGYNFKKGISNIKAVYFKSFTSKHVPSMNDQHAVVYKTMSNDEFFIGPQSDEELLTSVEMLVTGYSSFDRSNPNKLSYEDQLKRHINFTKKYPDSYSLIRSLANTLTRYNSKSDVEKVYNCFSDSNKNSYWGKKINSFIKNNSFTNSILPVWNADLSEPIIKDTSKFNLVAFSASWCGPCHKIIPVLKEVYKDLSGKLEMVYVSLDEPGTVENWRVLMKKEEIPWRSVLAMKDVKGITKKYTAQSIPFSLLVHPNGYTEIIDLRKNEDKEKLYRLVR